MKKISIVIALALIVALSSTVAFAAGAPKIISFSSEIEKQSADMAGTEARAIALAQKWIDTNHSKVRIISHSVTGNYVTGLRSTHGFSSVTILYEEK